MLNYFKKRRQCNMSLVFLASLCFTAMPAIAEDLREAIQHGLVTKPAEIFIFGSAENTQHARLDHIFNGLKLNRQDSLHASPTSPSSVTNDLALQVVDHYLSVFFKEKRLDLAKANLRLHRMVFLENPKDKAIASRLAEAESTVLSAQKCLYEAQKKYAKVVGKWPGQLTLPQIPDSMAMPSSVGQAIEQGWDNYLFLMSYMQKPNSKPLIKKRSMLELSKAIRSDWEQWTAAGLGTNTLKKALSETTTLRDKQLEAFKQNKLPALALIDAQSSLYKAQIAFNISEYTELKARYHILDSVGTLLAFINTSPTSNIANKEKEEISKPAEVVLSDTDKLAYPYPDYKPQFHAELLNSMSGQKPLSDLLSPCYVFAGTFKNKANAVALVNRLTELGFMAILKTEPLGSSVLIGPYDYPSHATIGMNRLKDMAHVQGVLIASK